MGPPPRSWRPTRWDAASTYSTHARRTPLQPRVAHASVQPTAAAPRARVHVNPIADATDPRLSSSSRQAAASPGLGVDFDALLGATSSSAGITPPLPSGPIPSPRDPSPPLGTLPSGPSARLRVPLPSGPIPSPWDPPLGTLPLPACAMRAAATLATHGCGRTDRRQSHPAAAAGRWCIQSHCGAACRRGRRAAEAGGHDGSAVQVPKLGLPPARLISYP